jgi:Spy/CpxP family protein refolding chaperone
MTLFRARPCAPMRASSRELRREQTGLGAGPRAMGREKVIGAGGDPLLWRSHEPMRESVEGSTKARGLLPREHPGHGDAMQRLAPAVLFLLTFVFAALLEPAPVHAADTKVITVPAGGPKAGRGKGAAPGGPQDMTALWWNDPKMVKTLSLTDEQREKMDEKLNAYRKQVPRDRRPEAFHEALVQGEWKDARKESEKVAKLAERSVQMRGTLKIDILSLLDEKQRELVVDRYPRLIYKPWRRAMSEGSQRE